jgi:hypothetical protein
MVSRLQILAFSLTCFGFLPLACAHGNAHGGYRVTVHDDAGRELPTFPYGSQTFVLGTYGERYDIRVENRTGRRVEAVVTVDGRDVVSGRVGDYAGERGYIIDAYDQVMIAGFRQNFDQVAAFRFVTPGASYSSRMGTPQNVGVIGVAIFPERWRERARPQRIAPPRSARPADARFRSQGEARAESAPAPSAPSGSPDDRSKRSQSYEAESASRGRGASAEWYGAPAPSTDNLGTEYGETVANSVREVAFQRADRTRPAAVLALRYDDRQGLISRGIAIDPPYRPYDRYSYSSPNAFPQNRRFAPPPPRD